jgi:hypothetical protein
MLFLLIIFFKGNTIVGSGRFENRLRENHFACQPNRCRQAKSIPPTSRLLSVAARCRRGARWWSADGRQAADTHSPILNNKA